MEINEEAPQACIAKADDFANGLDPAEQAALAELLNDVADGDNFVGFRAVQRRSGLITVMSPIRLRTSFSSADMGSDEFTAADLGNDEFADITMGGTDIWSFPCAAMQDSAPPR